MIESPYGPRPDGVETEDKADPYEIGKRPLKVSKVSKVSINGGVKGRDGSAEELDRDTGEEQATVGRTRRNDVG